MEIRNNSPAGGAENIRRVEWPSDITRSNRQGIEQTVEDLEQARDTRPPESPDEVALSPAGQLFARQNAEESAGVEDAARAERVAELRTAYQQGTLNTPERIGQAAARLLAPPA